MCVCVCVCVGSACDNFGKFIHQFQTNQDNYQESCNDINKITQTKCVFII